MGPGEGRGVVGLRDYLQVVKRRKWVIIQAIVLVPLAAVLYSLHEQPVYRASAQVLLSDQNLAASLSGTQQTSSSSIPSATLVATQAQLARVPSIARHAVARLKSGKVKAGKLRSSCDVAASQSTYILTFKCSSNNKVLAAEMVNAYAEQYTLFRRQLDTNAIESARRQVAAKVHQLVASGQKGTILSALEEREQELQTLADLQTSNATVVQLATRGGQTAPRTKRNALIALVLGILLGAALAFLREALDTRVRSAHEVAERLGLPLLGRVPEPPKRLRAENQLVMLEEPSSVAAEAFRVLRTNLEFATLDHDVRTVMITSAVEQEGKSTTIANLAVALARGGQRVILVDLDLRRPYLSKFFDLEGRPGVTQLVLGRAAFADALTRIPLSRLGRTEADNGRSVSRGQLAVLGSGPIPPDPGEFVSSAALSSVLEQLRKVADIVLIDAPPLLSVGDSLVLSAKVDAVLLATRMEKVRRPMLSELKRLIDTAPTRPLGFVVTGAESESGYGEGYGYGYYGYGYSAKPQPDVKTEDVAT